MVHIVLLAKTNANPKSRVWADFNCVQDCCDYVCKLFEDKLKKDNPHLPEITYDISDLYAFVDDVSLSMRISAKPNKIFLAARLELSDQP
jgi:uncharacterized protein Yka (UPF0111/DUF47 family)